MTQGERVKALRKTLKMSQAEFGDILDLSKVAISDIEKGKTKLTTRNANAICKAFDVNYFWLTEGVGEMFADIAGTVLSEAIRKYDLDEMDIIILEKYLHLSADKKKVFKEYFKSVMEEEKKMQETKKDEFE